MAPQSDFRDDLFANQVILIAGATSEIGRNTALELASLGASLALVDSNERALGDLHRAIDAATDRAGLISLHACDVRQEGATAELVDHIIERQGRITGLVNDGGGFSRKNLVDIASEGLDAAIRSTLSSGFSLMREVFSRWMADHGGSIVNLISDIWTPCTFSSHIGAASMMMQTLTESAAADWSSAGVRVNCVSPSLVLGPGTAGSTGAGANKRSDNSATGQEPRSCLREVVTGIVWLLSPAAAPATGSCLRIGTAPEGGVGSSGTTHLMNYPAAGSLH